MCLQQLTPDSVRPSLSSEQGAEWKFFASASAPFCLFGPNLIQASYYTALRVQARVVMVRPAASIDLEATLGQNAPLGKSLRFDQVAIKRMDDAEGKSLLASDSF